MLADILFYIVFLSEYFLTSLVLIGLSLFGKKIFLPSKNLRNDVMELRIFFSQFSSWIEE